ncbi:MAG: hypothetical protein IKH04_10200, partial [Kiritimatiellae bacterium]|nr:hypothetical protein [Kiritimatiellia bacterium]
ILSQKLFLSAAEISYFIVGSSVISLPANLIGGGSHLQCTSGVKTHLRLQGHQKPFFNVLRATVPLCDTLTATFRINGPSGLYQEVDLNAAEPLRSGPPVSGGG